VNHRLGAAIAALAVISAPVLASANVQSWAIVTGWDDNAQVVSALDHLWSQVELKHLDATVHTLFVGDISQVPPPCRQIAIRWDVTVIRQQIKPNKDYTAKFEHLLDRMAQHQCKITFVGAGGSGGTTNLGEVGPSQ
jgi:hypothetical protein